MPARGQAGLDAFVCDEDVATIRHGYDKPAFATRRPEELANLCIAEQIQQAQVAVLRLLSCPPELIGSSPVR